MTPSVGRRPRPVVWTSVIVPLVLLASLMGLFHPAPYADETRNWALQAKGQDVGNLIAVVVLLAAALRHHRRASARAASIWLGAMLYLIYAYMVYGFAVHLNALFLVYVAILGVCSWGVIVTVPGLGGDTVLPSRGRRSFPAVTLIAIGVVFALLWLSDLVPALLSGTVPATLQEAGLMVNPVHVIDLSVVLPALVVAGVATLQGRHHGLFWAAPWLCFSALMGASIVAAMGWMAAAGFPSVLAPALMVSVVVLVSLAALAWLLGSKPSSSESMSLA
ncbi:hypothetical protein [Aestuariimicrobium kwangyangense]|uniref:hypothetical protein n=1 Tax=Aestuariimicrobium kwangyangense TaxID=396389 RepID=UPI0012F8BE97|nr:hypothetical protein [Aestuariimicrobium kwangyangense]